MAVLVGKKRYIHPRNPETTQNVGVVAMEKTIQELRDRKNGERWKAVIALGQFGEPAIPYLHEALADQDKWVRYFAADTLGGMKDPGSVDLLVRRLADEDQDVRYISAYALGRIGDPRAAHALMQAHSSDNGFVRIFIEEALDRIQAAEVLADNTASSSA